MGELLFSEVERLMQNDEHLNSGSKTESRQFEERFRGQGLKFLDRLLIISYGISYGSYKNKSYHFGLLLTL